MGNGGFGGGENGEDLMVDLEEGKINELKNRGKNEDSEIKLVIDDASQQRNGLSLKTNKAKGTGVEINKPIYSQSSPSSQKQNTKQPVTVARIESQKVPIDEEIMI